MHERHDAHRRVHCAVLSTLRTVFRCVVLMRSYVTLAQGLAVSFHLIHGHSHAHLFLSVLFLLSFYLFLKSFCHLFLIPAMVPDDVSMNDPLCNSAIGSMVTFDYVTPDTVQLKGLLKVQRWGFRCLGCFGVFRVFRVFMAYGLGAQVFRCLGCLGLIRCSACFFLVQCGVLSGGWL